MGRGSERRLGQRFILALAAGSLGGSLMSCSGDTSTAPPGLRPAAQAYWALVLTPHAVNMTDRAPNNTLQFTAIPYTEAGTPLAGVGAVHFYRSTNDSTLTVDSLTGVATAHFATQGGATQVIASLTVAGVALSDTAYIQVTDSVPTSLATFSLQPIVGDSAKRSVDQGSVAWPVRVTNAAGDSLCSPSQCLLQVYYTSSNPLVATVDRVSGLVALWYPGTVTLTATTWAYGVRWADSVRFTVGNLLFYETDITVMGAVGHQTEVFSAPRTLYVGVGAHLQYRDYSLFPADVVFNDSTAVAGDSAADANLNSFFNGHPPTSSGNIAPFGGDTTSYVCLLYGFSLPCPTPQIYETYQNVRDRMFPVAGTYRYHSARYASQTDTLIVQ